MVDVSLTPRHGLAPTMEKTVEKKPLVVAVIATNAIVGRAELRGVEAIPVDVEVAVMSGLPAFHVVGMVDAAVQESRERVKAALKAAGS